MFSYNATVYDTNTISYNLKSILHAELYNVLNVHHLCDNLRKSIDIIEGCSFIDSTKQIVVNLNKGYYDTHKNSLIQDSSELYNMFREPFTKFVYDNAHILTASPLWDIALDINNIGEYIDFSYTISILDNVVIINL